MKDQPPTPQQPSPSNPPSSPPRRAWSYPRLRHGLVTPELVSGTVLVSVVIAVANEAGGIHDVFAITVLSMLVMWTTQVYILTIALQGRRGDNERVHLKESLRVAVRRASGILIATVPPLIFLVLGLFGMREGQVAYWTALWVEVGILAILGWIAFSSRGLAWYWQACGALATATLGLVVILLKIFVE